MCLGLVRVPRLAFGHFAAFCEGLREDVLSLRAKDPNNRVSGPKCYNTIGIWP